MTFDLKGRSILVTGGTGSFGKTLVRRLLEEYEPSRLVIYSRDELKQFEMARELDGPNVRYFIGDVRDADRLRRALKGIEIVVHAAAMKQVPTAEYNPIECIRTNILGAENVINASIDEGIERVIALSTDKAANPINLYGATKLCSDKLFIAGNSLAGSAPTRFAVVRYGNVVGSRGSVIPFFKECRASGRVPITDERMTRFWITLDQGVEFVLRSLERMHGGEVFVPKIPSMRIVDLANAIAPGCRHDYIGIRPGEKLHEVMVPADESLNTVEHDRYFVIQPYYRAMHPETFPDYEGSPGTLVEPGFEYRSDNNDEWVTEESLREMID